MNKIEKLFLYITSTLLFLSMFIMGFSSVCHAEDVTVNTELPYIINENAYYNSFLTESLMNTWITTFNIDTSRDFMIIPVEINDNPERYQMICLYDPVFDSPYNDDFTTTSFKINCANDSFSFWYNTTWGVITSSPYGSSSYYILGTRPTYNLSFGHYTNSYPVFVSSPIYDDITGNLIVANDSVGPVVIIGHATEPINDPNNFINGSNGSPIPRPSSPTINYYTWSTYNAPPIDTSSLESLLESLIDNVVYGFNYLSNNLKNQFDNLINNLKSLFDFVSQTIESAINKVIKAIQDLSTDLYNNFVSLFEPITQQLAYITAEVDVDLIQSEVETTSLMSDYSEVISIKDSFVSVFNDTSEPSTFIIPIHLENISILNVGTQYIDLSVINPVKSALRTFIWALVSFGLVVTILDAIPNYINGGGDE